MIPDTLVFSVVRGPIRAGGPAPLVLPHTWQVLFSWKVVSKYREMDSSEQGRLTEDTEARCVGPYAKFWVASDISHSVT